MTELVREAVRTPITFAEASEALRAAWPEGSRASVALLTAQWALETGRGRAMMNYNFAGLKSGPLRPHTYYVTTEVVARALVPRDERIVPLGDCGAGVRVRVLPQHPWCRFRAYDSATEGAPDYVALLRRRFAKAWPALERGDPLAFASALKSVGYFTAPLGGYAAALASLQREAMRR